MKKLKIMRIIDRMNIGGPALHVTLLTAGFRNEHFDTVLVSGKICAGEGDMHYLADKYKVRPIIIAQLKREIHLIRDLIAIWQLMQIIAREKPDIVHTHKSKAGLLGRFAAIVLRVPVIVHTFHGHIFHGYFSPLKTKFFIMIEKLLAKFSSRIVVISEAQRQEICRKYRIAPPHKFAVIPLGFDFPAMLDQNHIKKMRRPYLADEEIAIGIVGRLTAIKNHRMFLQAAAQVAKQADNIRFFIIGDGELRENLQELIQQLGLKNKVFFTGWIKNQEEIYPWLDIIALTSINEGTPVTLIEAMYWKKPVVSTPVGGVSDLVDHNINGLLIENIDQLTQALLKLAHDQQLRENFGKQGHNKVQNKYSIRRLTADLENLYQSMIG